MKTLTTTVLLALCVVSVRPAFAQTRFRFVIGADGRLYVIRPNRPSSRTNDKQNHRGSLRRSNHPKRRSFQSMPRPDIYLRPFSVYSTRQMRRLENWINNHPGWSPARKRSQIRWWRNQNEWMKRQNASRTRRILRPFGS